MLHTLNKKISISILIAVVFLQGVNPYAFFYLAKDMFSMRNEANIVDKIYLAKNNKNVVDSFFGHTEKAYAAINASEKE